MAKSLPYLESQNLNSIALPNAANFGFDYRLFIQVRHLSQQLTVAAVAGVIAAVAVVVFVTVSVTVAAIVCVSVAVAVTSVVTVHVAASAAITVCVAVAAAEIG